MLIDNQSGDVLGMAGFSNSGDRDDSFLLSPYEPGSVMKPLTIAAALDTGAVTRDFTYRNVPILYIQGLPIVNAIEISKDNISLRDILQYSMNIGAATVLAQLGNDNYGAKTQTLWANYLRTHYGFGRNPADALPDRASTTSAPYRTALSAFGTYTTVTPAELLGAYAAIAHDGLAVQPRICTTQALKTTQALHPASAHTVSLLLSDIYAADSGNAHTSGLTIGGKTGTVDLLSDEGYYQVGQDIGTYVGFINSPDKSLGLITILKHPRTSSFASHEAKAVWANTAQAISALNQ